MKLCPACGLRYPNEQTRCFVDRTELTEAPDPWIGALISGRYRIEVLLGEGGMATVYRARHTLQDKAVAIKLFRKELARDKKLRDRFSREATSTSRLAHPNIIEIFDSGEAEDGTPYLVMEYLNGESLEGLLSHGRIALPRAVEIVRQTLEGLARAHDFQVIHRDLKPDNLFVCRTDDGADHIKILDFGIARSMHDPRLTGAGEVFGTPQYMAPERITSIDAGPSADLYAMGVILFELASGKLPFEAGDITGYLLKHLRDKPPSPRSIDPSIPPALDALILRLLEKDPAKRPVDAHAVVKELVAIAATMPRPRPVPMLAAAVPTPSEGIKPPRVASSTLAPATLERWERRVTIFTQMLGRAFPGGVARPDMTAQLERVRGSLARMAEVRQRSMREQVRLEALMQKTREAQGRFGRAMDTLGKDLSHAREEIQKAKEYGEVLKRSATAFVALHAQVQQAAPALTEELDALYHRAVAALEHAIAADLEQARVDGFVLAKEREVADTQFQIDALRAQLERLSKGSDEDRAEVQTKVEALGADIAGVEQTLINDASALANALRGRNELSELFAELEADAA